MTEIKPRYEDGEQSLDEWHRETFSPEFLAEANVEYLKATIEGLKLSNDDLLRRIAELEKECAQLRTGSIVGVALDKMENLKAHAGLLKIDNERLVIENERLASALQPAIEGGLLANDMRLSSDARLKQIEDQLEKWMGDHECRCPVCGYKASCARKCDIVKGGAVDD